ncbi:hypothetical protein [Serratia ureilytica]|uniref:hypothetical protein n=1 Tax=Serratia ureilytica TaxID=300181 RepID=UPI0018D8F346|nr:hypothetical protein [Serratia ureilytica]MBH2883545.1 hypothetical protein [Serratia ureilytica]MBH3123821.1 hypothetical protein [Serratia ureilytica]
MNIKERNEKAKSYISDQVALSSQFNEGDFKSLKNYEKINKTLTELINVKAMGFRGVVATALTGKYLDPSFDPLNNFYSCNPRSIFENGIYYAFEELNIPCGKSDPLNVAKNTYILNDDWAKGKRPQSAAMAAVNFLRIIESEKNDETKSKLINFFFFKLMSFAKECGAIEIILPEGHELSNQVIANRLKKFTLKYPESGTIPQIVISLLLEEIHAESAIKVCGGKESVFGTNTTSKKPADIWLEKNKEILSLYEVTVKRVDFKRLDDCLQSLNVLGLAGKTIHFICRTPEDISTLAGLQDGSLVHKGKTFNFIDICSFIEVSLSMITSEQADNIVRMLHNFIKKVQRPVETKNGWNEFFEK